MAFFGAIGCLIYAIFHKKKPTAATNQTSSSNMTNRAIGQPATGVQARTIPNQTAAPKTNASAQTSTMKQNSSAQTAAKQNQASEEFDPMEHYDFMSKNAERIRYLLGETEPKYLQTAQAQKEILHAFCDMLPAIGVLIKGDSRVERGYAQATTADELEEKCISDAIQVEKLLNVLNMEKVPGTIAKADKTTILKAMKWLNQGCLMLNSPMVKEEYRPQKLAEILTYAYIRMEEIIVAEDVAIKEKMTIQGSASTEKGSVSTENSGASTKTDSTMNGNASTGASVREDIIGKNYTYALRTHELYVELFGDGIAYDETSIRVNIITGELSKVTDHVDMRMMSHLEVNPVTPEGVRSFARSCSEELGKKYEAFTGENWKDFLDEETLEKVSERLARDKKPREEERKSPAGNFSPDFEAYYMITHRHFGKDCVFLRKTDKGWRAVTRTGEFGCFKGSVQNISEKDVLDFLENRTAGTIYMGDDRRLSEKDLAYVLELMPKTHPDDRPEGKARMSTPISIYKDDVTESYYLKNGKWIPCADFPDIHQIYDRISDVAQYQIKYV